MSDRLKRSMALRDAKADVKMVKERANECWDDTKILANAVYLILEELTQADTPQTEKGEQMKNAHKFRETFGLYATELWAMPGKDFLEWLNAEADTPQTESTGSPIGDYRDGVGAWQTDCGWK